MQTTGVNKRLSVTIYSTFMYKKLCTEFYDLDKPEALANEVEFYEKFFQKDKPILSAMCGAGRVLIPLLRKGYHVEGVDQSKHMLTRCEEKCHIQKLLVTLFHQDLQSLSLPNKYGAIFIAFASIQLIHEICVVLRALHAHLLPGGSLVFETFIPEKLERGPIPHGRTVHGNGFEISINGHCTLDPEAQLEIEENRYQKIIEGKVVEEEKERLLIRWYQKEEMKHLLQICGFSHVNIMEVALKQNPHAIIYHAVIDND